jgi:hypothetical protein
MRPESSMKPFAPQGQLIDSPGLARIIHTVPALGRIGHGGEADSRIGRSGATRLLVERATSPSPNTRLQMFSMDPHAPMHDTLSR